MSNYIDPPEKKELTKYFLTLETKEQIRDFIDSHFPGWLIASTDNYTIDYPHLQSNWKQICSMNCVTQQKIVVVDGIYFDDQHSLLRTIAEVMTRKGYVVRRKEELTGCEDCQQAMPTKPIWRQFKQYGLNVPKTWKPVCSKCDIKRTQ